jgi:hypothetical protein
VGVELVAVSSVFEPELLQLPFSCKREHLCVYCACVLCVCVVRVCCTCVCDSTCARICV